jgi:hypothetical protein
VFSFGFSATTRERSAGVIANREASDRRNARSAAFIGWRVSNIVVRTTNSANIVRSEANATPGRSSLASRFQTFFSSGDRYFGGGPRGSLPAVLGSSGRERCGLTMNAPLASKTAVGVRFRPMPWFYLVVLQNQIVLVRKNISSRGPQRTMLRRIDTPQGGSSKWLHPLTAPCGSYVIPPESFGFFGVLLAKELSSLAVLLLCVIAKTLQAILSNGVAIVRQTLSRVFSAMAAERAKKGRKLVLRPGFIS